jgi:hypothetical protein
VYLESQTGQQEGLLGGRTEFLDVSDDHCVVVIKSPYETTVGVLEAVLHVPLNLCCHVALDLAKVHVARLVHVDDIEQPVRAHVFIVRKLRAQGVDLDLDL